MLIWWLLSLTRSFLCYVVTLRPMGRAIAHGGKYMHPTHLEVCWMERFEEQVITWEYLRLVSNPSHRTLICTVLNGLPTRPSTQEMAPGPFIGKAKHRSLLLCIATGGLPWCEGVLSKKKALYIFYKCSIIRSCSASSLHDQVPLPTLFYHNLWLWIKLKFRSFAFLVLD